jgi:general secretion pathway protein D
VLYADIDLNVKKMKLKQFITLSSKLMDKNIVSTENLNQQINFFSSNKIKENDLNNVLGSILTKNNLLLIDKGSYLQLINKNNFRNTAPSLVEDLSKINDYVVVSYYINTGSYKSTSMKNKIFHYLSKIGKVTTDEINNKLLISDYAFKIKLIESLINKMNSNIVVNTKNITLKSELTTDLFKMIFKYSHYLSNVKMKEQIEILPNYSNNSINILASEKMIIEISKYVKDIDKGSDTESTVQLYYLNNALAENIVKILKEILKEKNNLKKSANLKYSYSVDTELNAIIAVAPIYIQHQISTLIEKLDIPRKQVYVKASIIEINKGDLEKLGIKYGLEGLSPTSSGLLSLGTNLTGPSIAGNMAELIGGTITDSLSSSAFLLGISLEFLENKNVANVLSEPSILCVNNKLSNIYVGETESILTSSSSPSTGGIIKNFSREDIGLSLEITPRILQNNLVNLDISATLEGIVKKETTEVGTPTTTKRTIDSNAIIPDGKSIIIGGLIKKDYSFIKNKIPILGYIPWIGEWLFTYNSKDERETSLVIVLTPYIINSPADYDKLLKNLEKLENKRKEVFKLLLEDEEKTLKEKE